MRDESPMSSETLPGTGHSGADESTSRLAVGTAALQVIEFVAFWIAVALPFVYLPMIALGAATSYPLAFVGLLGANAIALAIGHGHERSS